MLTVARLARLTFVLIASMGLVAPTAAFPCLAPNCGGAHADGDDEPGQSCCSDRAQRTADPSEPGEKDRSSRHSAPCNCPPGCPSPCGPGKPPCPPVGMPEFLDAIVRLGSLGAPTPVTPFSIPPEGVFHPPRV